MIHLVNPFTPESDQCQNSPAASQEIWHHAVWRTWLFIAYSDEKWLYYKFSLHHSYNRFLKGWENTLFELRSERVKCIFLLRMVFRSAYPVYLTWVLYLSFPSDSPVGREALFAMLSFYAHFLSQFPTANKLVTVYRRTPYAIQARELKKPHCMT